MGPEVIEGIQITSAATMKMYGIDREDFVRMLEEQGFVCPICRKQPVCQDKRCKTTVPHGHMHIDHVHVRGWKRMDPAVKRTYIRGLVCQFDNRFVLARQLTLKKARAVVAYLEKYEDGRL